MRKHPFHGALAAILVAEAASVACGHPSPIAPIAAALSVTAVVPPYGATFRVTQITVGGTGFMPGATVTIDGVPAEGYFVNAFSMNMRAPAHAAGSVDVVVTNPGTPGESARLSGGFNYRPLGITSVTPAAGLAGEEVRILGFGFADTRLRGPAPSAAMDGVVSPWAEFEGGRCRELPRTADLSCMMVVVPEHGQGPVSLVVSEDDGHGLRESATVTDAFTYLSSTVSSTSNAVTAGNLLTVSWTQPPVPNHASTGVGGSRYVGLFRVGSSTSKWNVWTGDFHSYPATGSRTLTAPSEPGQYEFQFYSVWWYPTSLDSDPDWRFLIARSDIVTVTPAFAFDAVRPMWRRPGEDQSVDARPLRQRR